MTRAILMMSLLSLSLAACSSTGKYPISQCDIATHYPVACQEIGEGDQPAEIKTLDVPSFPSA